MLVLMNQLIVCCRIRYRSRFFVERPQSPCVRPNCGHELSCVLAFVWERFRREGCSVT